MQCRACGAADRATKQWPELPYYACGSCGVLFVGRQPSDAVLERAYREHYYPSTQASAPVYENTPQQLVDQLVACLAHAGILPPHDARVLDVGCGVGDFAVAALGRGADVDAVEADAVARARAVGRGVRVYPDLTSLAPERKAQGYDLIALLDVLEHVRQPLDVLTELRTLLRPGGTLYFSVPNYRAPQARLLGARWDQATNPTHLFLFSARSVRYLLARAGFVASNLPCTFRDPRMSSAEQLCSLVLQRLRLSGTLRILARPARTGVAPSAGGR